MMPTQTLRPRRNALCQQFSRIYSKQVDGTGLAVFRLVFCAVLLAEVLHLFYFRHLVFDAVPFVEQAPLSFSTPLVLWMATLLLLGLGLYTRAAAVVNYGFALVFFASLPSFSYMMTPVYIGMSFLFLFLPVSRRLSLDRLRLKLRHSDTRFRYRPPTTVSQLAYYVPVVVGIGFVYLDSTFYKLTSPLWLAGLGMWKTMSLPYEVQFNASFILNREWLVKFLGYLTLAFEFFFLFLFPFRRYRLGLMLVGVGLHVGILFFFTLPLFALGFGSIYLLMVPAGFWRRLWAPSEKAPKLTFYFDADCPLCARTRLFIEHFDTRRAVRFRSVQLDAEQEPALRGLAPQALLNDVHSVDARGRVHRGLDTYIRVLGAIALLKPISWFLRVPGIYHLAQAAYGFIARRRATERCTQNTWGYSAPTVPAPDEAVLLLRGFSLHHAKRTAAACGLAGLVLLQGMASYNTSLLELLRRKSGLEDSRVGRGLARATRAAAGPAARFFGITNHPIALDEHFAGYTRLVAVTYTGPDGVERFLPLTCPSGQPGSYLYGAVWLNWTYGIVSREIEPERLAKGIQRFTAFWAGTHHVSLDQCRFQVKVKKIEEPGDWEPDFLNRQVATGWQNAGHVTWTNRQFTAHLVPNISSL